MFYKFPKAAVDLLKAVADKPKVTLKQRLDAADTEQASMAGGSADMSNIALSAAATVQSWVETDDLGEGEGAGDRLISMLVGIADDDKNGELSPEEQDVVQLAGNAAWDYMSAKGVPDEDLDALFNSDDPAESNAAGERIIETLADALPDGDEAADAEMDAFAFGSDGQDAVFDSVAALDAVYKKKMVIRGGQKVKIRKRVSGHVRLSALQKVAIKKAGRKAHSSAAKARRLKSFMRGQRMGLHAG